MRDIKKIITHKKAIAISISNDTCLRAKENIEAAINKREYKTIVKILPLNISINSFLTSFKKFFII
tara:strand:+ start:20 stop:217 length:198 start_codon:yes stop_codon:yes gene_type:complete